MESLRTTLPMDQAFERIRDNWEKVCNQVSEAARQHGRTREDVLIVGVSKYVDVELTRGLIQAGCKNLGEARPQSIWSKAAEITEPEVHWHLIGHLQRNKAKKTLGFVDWVESVDSLRLLMQLESDAAELGVRPKILFEVNATSDSSKTGCSHDELLAMAEFALQCKFVIPSGLMGMASLGSSPDQARAEFATVRRYRDELATRFGDALRLTELSMGMSSDFREAIAEDSTMVRIGSALFEGILS